MKRTKLVWATLLFCAGVTSAHADEAALKAQVDALSNEVAELKALVRQMQAQRVTPPSTASTPAIAAAGTATASATTASAATTPAAPPVGAIEAPSTSSGGAIPGTAGHGLALGESTTLWGYGQLDYNHPTARPADTQADLTRAVIGFNHVFDESTRIYGELEWEHAVTSNVDQGESEVEQLYVEHALSPDYGVRVGLMLIPMGFLNENHEPTQYYGVERNLVEQAIIPTTWREGGVAAYGDTDSGFRWNIGITTGPDLGNWDPVSDEGRISPLGSIHQELQLAHAHDLSAFAALNWHGIPGLTVGASVFGGKIGQATSEQPVAGDENFPADNAKLLLSEVHARWQDRLFDFSALYSRGTISDTQALNLQFLGQPTPVPKSFWGGYVQGAWHALEWGNESSLSPFVRYEEFNTGASYAAEPYGLGATPLPTQRVWTAGANYYLNPNVVFKIDYQHFRYDDALLGYGNRFDLGLGYQF